jgi:hypothetical protein
MTPLDFPDSSAGLLFLRGHRRERAMGSSKSRNPERQALSEVEDGS